MAIFKVLKKLTCGLGKSSAGKGSDSKEILSKNEQTGKVKETKTLDPERVQQLSTHHDCPALDNKSPVIELAIPPTDAVKQNFSNSVGSRDPAVPPQPSSGMGTSQSKPKDLWDEAYKKLRLEEPKLFEKHTESIMTIEDNQHPGMTYDIDQLEGDQKVLYLATLIEKRV